MSVPESVIFEALENDGFTAYYQPQYNHSTGLIIGAEALARLDHPVYGKIPPSEFIPVLEKSGDIVSLDWQIFEHACRFLKKMADNGIPLIPISTNITRKDVFSEGFVERFDAIRQKYGVPADMLRVEITESMAIYDADYVNGVIRRLHKLGYVVELDDFGTGYSSLTILKDVDLDAIKLDKGFLTDGTSNPRRDMIVVSVVRMAKWLNLPVIAEGVENIEQADYLRSIGCNYIQGFLYSKPLTEDQYIELLLNSKLGQPIPQAQFIDKLNISNFWDPQSLETLIFANFVGAAAIFYFREDGSVEIVRVNRKYMTEIGMNMTEQDVIGGNPLQTMDEANRDFFCKKLREAIESEDEVEFETKRSYRTECCGTEEMFIRSQVRMIGKSDDEYLFYAIIRNVTEEKRRLRELAGYEDKFRRVTEQVNIYYWEYDVGTKEMRPCFRCMRDLGLPPLVRNYPEPAIELGIIPQDYAEMYRKWHEEIAAGVKELEAVIPLTVGRVPFRVKYVTEFDDFGRPVKAYGSAAYIND